MEILATRLSGWTVVSPPRTPDRGVMREELFREFRFLSFAEAIRFMVLVARGCDLLDHHPRWENEYRVVRVFLSTWEGGVPGISARDIRLAGYFDRMFGNFPGRHEPAEGSKEAPSPQVGD